MTTRPNESATQAEPAWLTIARGELGERELPGTAANRRILEYFGSTRLAAESDEVAWCAAFVGWCLEQAGLEGTGRANARSYLGWGDELDVPRVGCVVVLRRGDNPKQGHVAFYLANGGETGLLVRLIGGNQNNAVCSKLYRGADVLSYRWPEGVP